MCLEAKIFCLQMLLRLCVDRELLSSAHLSSDVQRAIQCLVRSLSDVEANDQVRVTDSPNSSLLMTRQLQDVSSNILATVKHPVLFYRLVSGIPCTDKRLHDFARRLALSFFLRSGAYITFPLSKDESITKSICHALKKQQTFSTTNEQTCYVSIGAHINILDIAIGPGFNRPPADASDLTRKEFDANLDRIIDLLNNLAGSIVDTGASHLFRTEAKGIVERVTARLQLSVRTKARSSRRMLDFWSNAAAKRLPSHQNDALSGPRALMKKTFKPIPSTSTPPALSNPDNVTHDAGAED